MQTPKYTLFLVFSLFAVCPQTVQAGVIVHSISYDLRASLSPYAPDLASDSLSNPLTFSDSVSASIYDSDIQRGASATASITMNRTVSSLNVSVNGLTYADLGAPFIVGTSAQMTIDFEIVDGPATMSGAYAGQLYSVGMSPEAVMSPLGFPLFTPINQMYVDLAGGNTFTNFELPIGAYSVSFQSNGAASGFGSSRSSGAGLGFSITAPVPEASSFVLALLAGIGTGVIAWQRRR